MPERVVRAASGEGRLRVEAVAVVAGRDLVVTIFGGSGPHVGAVALAQARPSLTGSGETSATSSVLTLLGHKDDVVAREAADKLAAALGCTVVVTAGLHVDQAGEAEIATLATAAGECVEELLAQLKAG